MLHSLSKSQDLAAMIASWSPQLSVVVDVTVMPRAVRAEAITGCMMGRPGRAV